jgi:hypothetical protein
MGPVTIAALMQPLHASKVPGGRAPGRAGLLDMLAAALI